jgi:hypothetical protein
MKARKGRESLVTDLVVDNLFWVFNLCEGLLWIGIGIGCVVRLVRVRQNRDVISAGSLLFLAFGISDFVEIHTGGWYKPWWLLLWKASCLAGFVVVYGLFRARRTPRAEELTMAGDASADCGEKDHEKAEELSSKGIARRSRLNSTTRHTIYLALAVVSVLLAIGALVLWGFRRGVDAQKAAPVPAALCVEGSSDYAAVLNRHYSQGVSPADNAAVPLWQAIGPSSIDPAHRARYFQMLGIAPLPEKGEYFVSFDDYFAVGKDGGRQDAESKAKAREQREEQLERVKSRAWSQQEFPEVAQWLAANERPLALVNEATKRPCRYDPLVCDEDMSLIEAPLPALRPLREVARALQARAMLQLGEGQLEDAWEDLLNLRRLARLIAQGPTVIDFLVGVAVNEMACQGDRVLLQYSNPTAAQIAGMRQSLEQVPKLPTMVDKMCMAERFALLEAASAAIRENPKLDADILGGMIHAWYDRLARACDKPARADRKAALRVIDDDLQRQTKAAREQSSFGQAILGGRKAISERTGMILLGLNVSSVMSIANAEDRTNMQSELNKLGFALAAYHADQGSYPAALPDLVPKYVASVPKDLNGAELHYECQGDGYLLYSVGENEKDDGARSFEEHYDDLVVRVPSPVTEKK